MSTPVTTIDRRYSDPEAVATEWDETRRILEAAQLFWISTVRADGRPHVTPVVAVWVDGVLYFSTGDHEQKAANMIANPHVILTTGCNHWDRGLDVVVEGDAVRVTDQALLGRLAEVWATRLGQALAARGARRRLSPQGRRHFAPPRDPRVLGAAHPDRRAPQGRPVQPHDAQVRLTEPNVRGQTADSVRES